MLLSDLVDFVHSYFAPRHTAWIFAPIPL